MVNNTTAEYNDAHKWAEKEATHHLITTRPARIDTLMKGCYYLKRKKHSGIIRCPTQGKNSMW